MCKVVRHALSKTSFMVINIQCVISDKVTSQTMEMSHCMVSG